MKVHPSNWYLSFIIDELCYSKGFGENYDESSLKNKLSSDLDLRIKIMELSEQRRRTEVIISGLNVTYGNSRPASLEMIAIVLEELKQKTVSQDELSDYFEDLISAIKNK